MKSSASQNFILFHCPLDGERFSFALPVPYFYFYYSFCRQLFQQQHSSVFQRNAFSHGRVMFRVADVPVFQHFF